MRELERAERALAQVNAALEKAQAGLKGELAQVQRAKDDLEALDAKILALAPDATKELLRLDGQRGGVRMALEVLERARLPKAEAAAAEAQVAAEAARREYDAAEKAARFARLTAERARLEADLVARVRAFRAEVEPLLAAHRDAWRAGAAVARELGEEWAPNDWPDPSDAYFFEKLAARAAPPREPTAEEVAWQAHDAMVRAAQRRADERFLASLREGTAPAPPTLVRESGLSEEALARMRAADQGGGPVRPDLPRLVNPDQPRGAAGGEGR